MNKTMENLAAAFAGESQARNKYTFFAKVARKEGYNYIGKLFEETAENERRHALEHFKLLGHLGDTAANLKAAIEGEDYETVTMYREFAAQAEADGNAEAARVCRRIGEVEAHHRDRYKKLLERVENGTVFKREKPIKWKCDVCGFISEGTEPPQKCPCCQHPQNYFEPADLSVI